MIDRGDAGASEANRPMVTVVTPTFRRPHLLGRLVAALERQTLPAEAFEVVIVDNDSPDETSEQLAKLAATSPLRLRPLVEHRQSPAAARNAGWRAATTDVIAFIDDDCVPEPGWLEAGLTAMQVDERLGVVQGCTLPPEEAPIGNWTLWRQITEPTPYFEGCNIFYRRPALAEGGGFDEDIGNYGEDAALGWAVLEAGWRRGYADDAIAYHDVEERGVSFHLRTGLLERNVARIAKRYPEFRGQAFWRPWAFRHEDAVFTLAVLGLVLATRRRSALLLTLPYLRLRWPPPELPNRTRWFLERVAVDTAQFVGMRWGSVRYGLAVL